MDFSLLRVRQVGAQRKRAKLPSKAASSLNTNDWGCRALTVSNGMSVRLLFGFQFAVEN